MKGLPARDPLAFVPRHAEDGTRLINGVPEDRWGTWCAHGVRIMAPHPDDTDTDFPRAIIVDPWPCPADGCTREALIADMEAAEAEYWAEMQAEARRAGIY